MFWVDLIRRWRCDAGGLSPRLIRAAGDMWPCLPTPQPSNDGCVSIGSFWMHWVLPRSWLLLKNGQVRAILAAVSP